MPSPVPTTLQEKLTESCEEGIVIPMLEMRKRKFREVVALAPNHPVASGRAGRELQEPHPTACMRGLGWLVRGERNLSLCLTLPLGSLQTTWAQITEYKV